MLQLLYPSYDVVEDFFGEGFFDGGIFCGHACGAMLEEVVEAFVLLDDVALVLGEGATQGGQILGSDDLQVFATIQCHHWTFDFGDVVLWIVVDEPFNPWVLHLWHLAELFYCDVLDL